MSTCPQCPLVGMGDLSVWDETAAENHDCNDPSAFLRTIFEGLDEQTAVVLGVEESAQVSTGRGTRVKDLGLKQEELDAAISRHEDRKERHNAAESCLTYQQLYVLFPIVNCTTVIQIESPGGGGTRAVTAGLGPRCSQHVAEKIGDDGFQSVHEQSESTSGR